MTKLFYFKNQIMLKLKEKNSINFMKGYFWRFSLSIRYSIYDKFNNSKRVTFWVLQMLKKVNNIGYKNLIKVYHMISILSYLSLLSFTYIIS